jgi:thioredoxin 1
MLLDQTKFEADVLGSAEPVLVDFFGTWCGPCREQAPVLEGLAEQGYAVCKVDIQARPDLAVRYGVSALPTLVVVRGGEEVARFVGVQPERKLRAALDQARAAA